MKKKILSLTAVVLAMAMTTTSVFAAVDKGSGDVDQQAGLSSNDVSAIIAGSTDANGDYNGDGVVDSIDATLIMQALLRPKNVQEAYELKVKTSGEESIFASGVSIFNPTQFNGTVTPNESGLGVVANPFNPDPTIKDAIDAITDQAALKPDKVSDALNRIYFNSAVRGPVYLNKEDGWAMFCWAVSDLVPLCNEDAEIINKVSEGKGSREELKASNPQFAALEEVKGILKIGNTINLTGDDIKNAKDKLYVAFPNGMDETKLNAAAEKILSITDGKYEFTALYGSNASPEVITADSSFVQTLIGYAKDYENVKLSKVNEDLGDSIEVSAHLIANGADHSNDKGATFFVQKTAKYDSTK